jgi:hypothetical protein
LVEGVVAARIATVEEDPPKVPSNATRTPVWSQYITEPVARHAPAGWRPALLTAIRAAHTLIFVSVGAAIALFAWDGARGRTGRRPVAALGLALAESAVYLSNNQVCPLTPLAEELGAERGAVADMFLPGWLARRIPIVASSALVLGLALNLRAAARRRRSGGEMGGSAARARPPARDGRP